jgi:hypothetical protein
MRANSLIVTVHQAAVSVQHRFVQFAGMSSRPAYRMLRLGQIIQSGNYVGAQRARFTDTAIVCLNGSRRYYIFLLAMRRRGHMLSRLTGRIRRSLFLVPETPDTSETLLISRAAKLLRWQASQFDLLQ